MILLATTNVSHIISRVIAARRCFVKSRPRTPNSRAELEAKELIEKRLRLSWKEEGETIARLKKHVNLYKELAQLRDELVVCYRIGKQPTCKLLDRLPILSKREQALKETP